MISSRCKYFENLYLVRAETICEYDGAPLIPGWNTCSILNKFFVQKSTVYSKQDLLETVVCYVFVCSISWSATTCGCIKITRYLKAAALLLILAVTEKSRSSLETLDLRWPLSVIFSMDSVSLNYFHKLNTTLRVTNFEESVLEITFFPVSSRNLPHHSIIQALLSLMFTVFFLILWSKENRKESHSLIKPVSLSSSLYTRVCLRVSVVFFFFEAIVLRFVQYFL